MWTGKRLTFKIKAHFVSCLQTWNILCFFQRQALVYCLGEVCCMQKAFHCILVHMPLKYHWNINFIFPSMLPDQSHSNIFNLDFVVLLSHHWHRCRPSVPYFFGQGDVPCYSEIKLTLDSVSATSLSVMTESTASPVDAVCLELEVSGYGFISERLVCRFYCHRSNTVLLCGKEGWKKPVMWISTTRKYAAGDSIENWDRNELFPTCLQKWNCNIASWIKKDVFFLSKCNSQTVQFDCLVPVN